MSMNINKLLICAMAVGTVIVWLTFMVNEPKAENIPQVTTEEGEECNFFAKGGEDCPLSDEQVKMLDQPHFIGTEQAPEVTEGRSELLQLLD